MQIGVIGLGRMGANIVRRLASGGHHCVAFDRRAETTGELTADGIDGADSLSDLVRQLHPPRVIWLMLPAGAPTDDAVTALGALLQAGDTVIDGGNTFYRDDIRRAKALKDKGIHYVDVGTSGGIWGLRRGYCMMVGGAPESVAQIDPILQTLAPGLGQISRTRRPAASDTSLHCSVKSS